MKRTVEVKYGITLHTKPMIKVNELTTGGKTSNLAKHWSLAHPDLFRESEINGLVSSSYIHNCKFYSQLFACLKAFRLNVSFNGGQTSAFSEPIHLKRAHGKACLTAPDN